ncbi:MFS transporter [Thermomonospora umbrina]|uniref:EmrB/QacA subfamily drug resistance transporter n=1 Tax=Thermomonospora umbrina TaxID=111806 RepID=A0A3D9SWN2_9ACTN|nr:MFS transporter [Thermomonospora umbrina]REE96974.1 EmrB/QacA subfamily drug resistance transporter [Thermomonospora umbrina]
MRPTDVRTGGTPPGTAAPARFGPVFIVVAAGVAMSNLDMFIVNVALPEIGDGLSGAPLSALSWVLNAYAVVFAALLVPLGNVADRIGARRTYLLGTAIFTVASALCALAPSVWWLVAARVVQAAGAAMLMPSSLSLLLAAAPPERRVAAVRAWTAIGGVAAALGPVIGGLLTEVDWRWIFLINLPVGLAVLVVGPRVLPRTPLASGGGRPDLVGATVLTIAVAALALGVVKSEDWGWGSVEVIGSLAAAVVLAVAFVVRSARHPDPVLPLSLLRVPVFGTATLASVLFGVAFAAMLLSTVLWCREVWDWSPLRSGLAVAPGPLMVPGLAIGAGPVIQRVGAAVVSLVGCLFFAAGLGWWILVLDADSGYAVGMLPGMVLTGIGVGLTLPTLIGAAVSAVPPQSFATGSAVVTMARQIGVVVGVAMLVAAFGTPNGPDETLAAFDDGWLLTVLATAATALAALFLRRTRTP